MIMIKVIIRDPIIAGCDRMAFTKMSNERARASRIMENSVIRRVSAQPTRLLPTTIGLVPRIQQRTHGNRNSTMAIRTTTIRTTTTMFGPSGDEIKV